MLEHGMDISAVLSEPLLIACSKYAHSYSIRLIFTSPKMLCINLSNMAMIIYIDIKQTKN